MYKWKEGDTWQKVSFRLLGDETRYREFFDINPGLSPIVLPAVGESIKAPSSSQNEPNINDRQDEYYFPWADVNDYYRRLENYSGIALFLKKDINGVFLG